MGKIGGIAAAVIREILTSLPGQHQKTQKLPPEGYVSGQGIAVGTGGTAETQIIGFWHAALGISFWLLWLGWGIYMWFFANAVLNDFYIAAAICLATFAFTIVGVPLVRLFARNRRQQ